MSEINDDDDAPIVISKPTRTRNTRTRQKSQEILEEKTEEKHKFEIAPPKEPCAPQNGNVRRNPRIPKAKYDLSKEKILLQPESKIEEQKQNKEEEKQIPPQQNEIEEKIEENNDSIIINESQIEEPEENPNPNTNETTQPELKQNIISNPETNQKTQNTERKHTETVKTIEYSIALIKDTISSKMLTFSKDTDTIFTCKKHRNEFYINKGNDCHISGTHDYSIEFIKAEDSWKLYSLPNHELLLTMKKHMVNIRLTKLKSVDIMMFDIDYVTDKETIKLHTMVPRNRDGSLVLKFGNKFVKNSAKNIILLDQTERKIFEIFMVADNYMRLDIIRNIDIPEIYLSAISFINWFAH